MNQLDQELITSISNRKIKIPIELDMVYNLGLINLISDVLINGGDGWHCSYNFEFNSDIFRINSVRRFTHPDPDSPRYYISNKNILNYLPDHILNKIAANEVKEFINSFDNKYVINFFNTYKDIKLIKLFNEYKLFS